MSGMHENDTCGVLFLDFYLITEMWYLFKPCKTFDLQYQNLLLVQDQRRRKARVS